MIALILQMEEGLQLKIVLLLWLWWNERNAVREGERRRTMADLVYVMNKLAAEFLEMNKKPTTTATKRGQSWCKPLRDWLKVNVDGAFSASTKMVDGAL
jgi:hypothetical protein